MSEIRVCETNCEEVAKLILERLATKDLTLTSFYVNKNEAPKVLKNARVWGDYTHDQGKITIRLTPRRNLFWDSRAEKVTVDMDEYGVIVLKRILPEGKIIFRVIVY